MQRSKFVDWKTKIIGYGLPLAGASFPRGDAPWRYPWDSEGESQTV